MLRERRPACELGTPRGILFQLRGAQRALLLIASMAALGGCEEEREGGEERSASPGIRQADSADGPLLDEDEACERVHDLLSGAIDDLSCNDVELQDCPDLVRPAGAAACTRFAEESLEECEDQVGDFESCDDFDQKRCILVSVLDEVSEGCVPPSAMGTGEDSGSGEGSDSGTDVGETDPTEQDSGVDAEPEEAGVAEPAEAGTAASDVEAGTTDDALDASAPQPDAAPAVVEAGSSESTPDAAPSAVVDAAPPAMADAAPDASP